MNPNAMENAGENQWEAVSAITNQYPVLSARIRNTKEDKAKP